MRYRNSSELKKIIEALPEVYHPIYGHPEYLVNVSRKSLGRFEKIREIYELLEKKKKHSLSVLDLGCAQGYISLCLASLGAVVTGVDSLEENIDVCNLLASENPKLNVNFIFQTIEDFFSEFSNKKYDMVIGLSVFHHLIFQFGQSYVNEILETIALHSDVAIFELATALEEPLYWAKSQPKSPRELLMPFSFVHKIAECDTHLSKIKRPVYFASNTYWYLGDNLDEFERSTYHSHEFVEDNFQRTRQYFFSNKKLVKKFLTNKYLAQENRLEIDAEINFLSNSSPNFDMPKIIDFGNNSEESWLVREYIDGQILSSIILGGISYDKNLILSNVLKQLVNLEDIGLYHNDIRTWNVLVRPSGHAMLIDYGSISDSKEDCVWPHNIFSAFLIFVYEVATGQLLPPFPQRQPYISPANIPMPYQQWILSVWQRRLDAWDFSFLFAEFNKMKQKYHDIEKEERFAFDDNVLLWMRNIETYINTLNTSSHAVNRRTSDLELELREQVQKHLRDVIAERDYFREQFENISAERQLTLRDFFELTREKDLLQQNLATVTREKDLLQQNLATVTREKDLLQQDLATVTREKDLLQQDLATVTQEKDLSQQGFADVTREKDLVQQNLGEANKKLNQVIGTLENITSEKEKVLRDLSKTLAAKDVAHQNVIALNHENEKLRRELEEAISAQHEYWVALDQIYRSKSWKLLLPLRFIKKSDGFLGDIQWSLMPVRFFRKTKVILKQNKWGRKLLKKIKAFAPGFTYRTVIWLRNSDENVDENFLMQLKGDKEIDIEVDSDIAYYEKFFLDELERYKNEVRDEQ